MPSGKQHHHNMEQAPGSPASFPIAFHRWLEALGKPRKRPDEAEHLLIAAARIQLSEENQSTIIRQLNSGQLNWKRLTALARRHKLLPLLHRHLSKKELSALVPGWVLEALRYTYQQTLAANILLLDELKSVLLHLNTAGIDAILLKGAQTARTLYPDPALRPMGDIDLLVRSRDLVRVDGLLQAQGYVKMVYSRPIVATGLFDPEYVKKSLHLPIIIDLHRHFHHGWRFQIGFEELWQRARRHNWNDGWSFSLDREDGILHQCIHHGVSYHNFPFISMVDLHETINASPPDWEQLGKRARQWGVATIVWLGLELLEAAYPGKVPEKVRTSLRPGRLARLLLPLYIRKEAPDYAVPPLVNNYLYLPHILTTTDNWRGRTGYVAEYLYYRLKGMLREH